MIPILISIVVSVFILGLTAYINIKIKFAPDEKTAMSHAKTLIYRIALIICCSYSAYILIREFTLDAPLDRASLGVILLNSFSLLYIFIVEVNLGRIMSLMERLISIVERLSCVSR